jgi:ABC-type dipeptide/oligopeptide/nickel transport system ATPase subunit
VLGLFGFAGCGKERLKAALQALEKPGLGELGLSAGRRLKKKKRGPDQAVTI